MTSQHNTRNKMAVSSAEIFSPLVVNFLDSEFGEDVEKLKEIKDVLEKHENISKSIDSKVKYLVYWENVMKMRREVLGLSKTRY